MDFFFFKENLLKSPLSLYHSFMYVVFFLGSKAKKLKCGEKIVFLGLPHHVKNGVARVTAGKRHPPTSDPCGLVLGYVLGDSTPALAENTG